MDASPTPETQWLKDGQPLVSSQKIMTSYNAPRGIATLLIDNARVNDIGNYTCVVSNSAGTEKSEPNLLILKGPQEESGPKQHTLIVNPLEDQECCQLSGVCEFGQKTRLDACQVRFFKGP